jgi:hypothetical protein
MNSARRLKHPSNRLIHTKTPGSTPGVLSLGEAIATEWEDVSLAAEDDYPSRYLAGRLKAIANKLYLHRFPLHAFS